MLRLGVIAGFTGATGIAVSLHHSLRPAETGVAILLAALTSAAAKA